MPVARRYIRDARELLLDENVAGEVLDRAIPAYARLAVEAAAHEVYFRRQLTSGAARSAVEAAWTGAVKTRQRVALALYDDKGRDLGAWQQSPHRQRTLTLAGPAVHHGTKRDADDALKDVAKTVDDLLGRRP